MLTWAAHEKKVLWRRGPKTLFAAKKKQTKQKKTTHTHFYEFQVSGSSTGENRKRNTKSGFIFVILLLAQMCCRLPRSAYCIGPRRPSTLLNMNNSATGGPVSTKFYL